MLKQRGIGSDTALASDLKTEDLKRIRWAQGLAYPKDLAEYEAVDGCDRPVHRRAQGSHQHVVPFGSIEFQNPSHWGRFNFFVLVLREREGYISYPNTFIPFGAHRVKSSRLTHYEWLQRPLRCGDLPRVLVGTVAWLGWGRSLGGALIALAIARQLTLKRKGVCCISESNSSFWKQLC